MWGETLMSIVYLMCGIIASGKSQWAQNHVDSNTFIVSKDRIREMLYGKYDYRISDEVLIDTLTKNIIKLLLWEECNIIVDECWDTITEGARERLTSFCKTHGADEVRIIYCSSTIGNVGRQIHSKGWSQELAERVYEKMKKKLEPPEHYYEEVRMYE